MLKVAALYQFAPLPDFRALREPLRALCAGLSIRGTILLAHEGINGTVAGTADAIDALVLELRDGALFGGRLDNLELKFSRASTMPFAPLKVRLKKEIVTLGDLATDPTRAVGTYVEPQDWNALIASPDTLVIDTRNRFEVAMGTFQGAVDPQLASFGAFKDFVTERLDPEKHQKIAMFCTGGIRCEKATAYLRSLGLRDVFHLKGGILKYLEEMPKADSMWRGECFVFDERVSVGHGLGEGEAELCRACRRPLTQADRRSPYYRVGISCAYCHGERSEEDRVRYAERHRQVGLAGKRGAKPHIGG